MKLDAPRPVLLLALLLPFLAPPALAGPLVPAPPQDINAQYRAWIAQFDAANKINEVEQISKMIKKDDIHAITLVMETCEAIAAQPSDLHYVRLEGLKKGWDRGMKTDFVSKMERYFSLIDPVTKRNRNAAMAKFKKRTVSYAEAVEKKEYKELALLGMDFEGLAKGFLELGDKYYASQAYFYMGHCYDEYFRKGDADLDKASIGFGSTIDLRAEIGLKDKVYRDTQERATWLRANGYGSREPGANAGGAEPVAGPKSAGEALSSAMTFELAEEWGKPVRPNYNLDEMYGMWPTLSMREKGTETPFHRVEGPRVMREGANEVKIDADGDGEAELPIPLTGNLTTVEMDIGSANEQRKWAFRAVIGIDKDIYQGIEVNLGPSDQYMNIYVVPAASVVGEIAGHEVQIFDEDMDAVYGGAHQRWGNPGMTEKVFQPEFDSFLVKGEKRARPWSEYQQIDGVWYKLETEAKGLRLNATPVELKTGKLKLKYKGGKPTWLIVKGERDFENAYFDLADGAVEVPIGRYELYTGELRKGKKRQVMKSLIIPGKNTPRWMVEEGKETVIELGSPYGFDFAFEQNSDEVQLAGASVVVVGSAGERYERVWGAVPRPEVSIRKAGGRRGSKPEKTKLVDNLVDGKHSFEDCWRPLDITLAKRFHDKAEMQLTAKKNKLFGKINSEWKEE